MANLHETIMGQKFFQRDVPALIKALNRLADAAERQEGSKRELHATKDDKQKMLWFRAGITVALSAEEYAEVIKGTDNGRRILSTKVNEGDFALDGNSYIPVHEENDDSWWPVQEEVDYDF